MKTALIDTNILIDHLKGRPEARACLQECLQQKLKMACSVITRIELLSGMRPEEDICLSYFSQVLIKSRLPIQSQELPGNI